MFLLQAIQCIAREDPRFQYKSALDFIDNRLYDLLENAGDHLYPLIDHCIVFCHRDCWGHNIFYGCDPKTHQPKSCRLVDFQLCCFGPASSDVLSFLYNCLSFTDRKRSPVRSATAVFSETIEHYLQFYYQVFEQNLKVRQLDAISRGVYKSFEDFYNDCRRSLLPMLAAKCVCEPLTKMPKSWPQTAKLKEPEKYNHYMNVDRKEMLQRIAAIDDQYLTSIRQPVEELMDYFGYKPQEVNK